MTDMTDPRTFDLDALRDKTKAAAAKVEVY